MSDSISLDANNGSLTLLCVDDEPGILSALRRLFRPHGYNLLQAESGASGLSLLERQPVDLVLSDMRMPEMDGVEFLEQVRKRWPDTVRIVLTGYADIQSTVAAINRGAVHRYLAKPWDDHQLLLVVRETLNQRRLERQNQELLALTTAQNQKLEELNSQLEAKVQARTRELAQVNDMLEHSFKQLEDNFLLSMDVFAGLLELRDGSLAGHSRRVATLAHQAAGLLDLDPAAQRDLYVAGLLHNIGKIGFSDELLNKPLSRISGEELQEFRRHPLKAEAALLPLAQLQRAARWVRWQHERLDGKGFPDGLTGEQLPLPAQLLAAARDYHDLLAGRLGTQKQTPEAAAELLKRGIGMRYSEAAVNAVLQALALPSKQARERQVAPHDVDPGMVLSRNLLSPQGTLLLAAGIQLDERVALLIREVAQRQSVQLEVWIRLAPAEQPAQAPAPSDGEAHERTNPAVG